VLLLLLVARGVTNGFFLTESYVVRAVYTHFSLYRVGKAFSISVNQVGVTHKFKKRPARKTLIHRSGSFPANKIHRYGAEKEITKSGREKKKNKLTYISSATVVCCSE